MSVRKVTDEQAEKIVALRERGWSYDRIASEIGSISGSGVFYQCLKHGAVSPRQRRHEIPTEARVVTLPNGRTLRRFTAAEDERLLDLATRGWTRPKIARELGRAQSSIIVRLLMLGLREDLPAKGGHA